MELSAMTATLSPLAMPRAWRALARRFTRSWSWAKGRPRARQRARRAVRHVPGQGLGAAGGGYVAQAHLGQAEPRVVAGDSEVAAHGELDAGTEGIAIGGGDEGHLQRQDEPPEVSLP